MATKELQTRIALKYDTYANWTNTTMENVGANLVLLKGEIGICEIPADNANATTAPTVLFKVGDGEHKFSELKWASALAADVYSWAKAETVELEIETEEVTGENDEKITRETGRKLVFKAADGTEIHNVDLSDFATDADVTALAQRISAVEAKFSGNDSVEAQISGLDGRLDVLEGDDTTDGSVAKALKDAKDYADSLASNYDAAGTAASEVAKLTEAGGAVATNTQNIADLQDAVGNAEEKNADGTVKTPAKGLYKLIAEGDNALSDRLELLEAFFNAADHDGEDEESNGLYDALDTLKEIQEYLTGDGSDASDVVSKIAALEDEFATGGRVTVAESNISTLNTNLAAAEGEIDELQSITKSYLTKGADNKVVEDAIKSDIDAAKQAAKAAQDDADAANLVLNGTNNDGLVAKVNSIDAIVYTAASKDEAGKDIPASGLVVDVAKNAQDIAEIQDKYVSTDGTNLMFGKDIIIFNCGGSGVPAVPAE